MKDYLSIGEFSKKIGKSTQTLRRWDDNGYLKSDHKSPSGKRYYHYTKLNEYLNLIQSNEPKITIGYCRVSTRHQKDDLERQIESMENYLISQGNSFKIIKDIGSGINYNKKGLNDLLELITSNKVNKIVLLYKDRLVRFGFEIIENICKIYNVEIEIINQTEKNTDEELVEDLIQIITVYACKLNGKRSNKSKKIIDLLVSEDVSNKKS